MPTMQQPVHPGAIIQQEILEPLGLSVSEAAAVLGVARPTLSRLLNQRSALSPEMAIRVEKAFGPRADHLMRVQLAHDIAAVRDRADTIEVKRYEPA